MSSRRLAAAGEAVGAPSPHSGVRWSPSWAPSPIVWRPLEAVSDRLPTSGGWERPSWAPSPMSGGQWRPSAIIFSTSGG